MSKIEPETWKHGRLTAARRKDTRGKDKKKGRD